MLAICRFMIYQDPKILFLDFLKFAVNISDALNDKRTRFRGRHPFEAVNTFMQPFFI
jgi:hypothetical protein